MAVRRLLEWAIFLSFWFGLGYIVYFTLYWRMWLQNQYPRPTTTKKFTSLGIVTIIMVILYIIVRYLALMLYAKCKVKEERMIQSMKKEVRELKQQDSDASNYQTNLVYENDKQLRKSKKNKNQAKRFHSLDDLRQQGVQVRKMKDSRSLDLLSQSQRTRVKECRPGIYEVNGSVLFYEEPATPYGTPPPVYQNLSNAYYNSDDEIVYFAAVPSRRANERRVRSADFLLDIDEPMQHNLQVSRSMVNMTADVVDGSMPRKLRKAPPPPVIPGAKRSRSLTRMPTKAKSLHEEQIDHHPVLVLQHSRAPLQQNAIEVHQPHDYYYSQPRTHAQQPRPQLVKTVLVSNTLNRRK